MFDALGGWRTVAEGIASRMVFLLVYLPTGRVPLAALVAVGAVAGFAAVRVCTDRKYLSAVIPLAIVGLSAVLAGGTGHAVDFYLPTVLVEVIAAVICAVSILVRFPVFGLAFGALKGERLSWRRDRDRRRRYQLCTALFLAKFVLATALLLPLYLAALVTPLAIAETLLGPVPLLCLYLCHRIVRDLDVQQTA